MVGGGQAGYRTKMEHNETEASELWGKCNVRSHSGPWHLQHLYQTLINRYLLSHPLRRVWVAPCCLWFLRVHTDSPITVDPILLDQNSKTFPLTRHHIPSQWPFQVSGRRLFSSELWFHRVAHMSRWAEHSPASTEKAPLLSIWYIFRCRVILFRRVSLLIKIWNLLWQNHELLPLGTCPWMEHLTSWLASFWPGCTWRMIGFVKLVFQGLPHYILWATVQGSY